MADYQNLTSLSGLSVGDVITYNQDMLIDFSNYKVRIELHGQQGTQYDSTEVTYGGKGGLTTFLFTPMRSGLTEYYFSGKGGVSLCASTEYNPYTRIAVAGDGGYGYLYLIAGLVQTESYGGKGGGETGGSSTPYNTATEYSRGGKQTTGGYGIGGTGGFGVGFSQSNIYRGGAGWYDGGKGGEDSYNKSCVGQGGGSGFVIGHTTDTYPTGYLDSDTTNKISLAIDEYQLTQGGSSITTGATYKMVVTIISVEYDHETKALVTFDTNGGHPISPMIVDKGSAFKMVVPTRESANKYQLYEFIRWYKDGVPFEEGTIIEEDITLRASWLIKQLRKIVPYYKKEETLQKVKTYVKNIKYIPKGFVDIETTRYPYKGQSQTVKLDPGFYRLRCWGAQGGSYSNTYQGGAGGYSEGVIKLEEPTTLFLYAGGQPSPLTSSGTSVAGFNGGGTGTYHSYSGTTTYPQGGGGATDIRIGSTSLYARVIVAGGGAGSTNSYNALNTRFGGGLSSGGYSGYEATQTTGYAFGQGQSGINDHTNYKYAAPGSGGGWYGGKSSTEYSDNTNYSSYSAGGSGYVYTKETASNYPSGCLLNKDYYLFDAKTIAGNMSIPDPNDFSQTTIGRLGNGYITISTVEAIPGEEVDEITLEPVDLFYCSAQEEL